MTQHTKFGESILDFDETYKKRKRAKLPHHRDERRHQALVLLLAKELMSVEDNEFLDLEVLSTNLYENAGFEAFHYLVVKESIEDSLKMMGWSTQRRDGKKWISRGALTVHGPVGVDLRCCDEQVAILIDNWDSYPHFQENYAYPALPTELQSDDSGDKAKQFIKKLFLAYYINIEE